MKTTRQALATIIALLLLTATQAAFAQTNTAFTYQGRLTDNGTTASGTYDLRFALFDAGSDGTQQGALVNRDDVPVTNGIFTVSLDFGSALFATGAPRFLQISVRPGNSTEAYIPLTPRQPLAPTPYALHALTAATADTATNATNATTATNATQLGGLDASQFVTGAVVRNMNGLAGNVTLAAGANVTLTPSGNTLTIAATGGTGGTGNFIQNTTTPQADSNFNISGNGTVGGTFSANTVNAATQFNLNGNRVLAVSGAGAFLNSNTFAGMGAGANTTPNQNGLGNANSFFGKQAGAANTTGSSNAFFGSGAGAANTTGGNNAFVGANAGFFNTTGESNVFVGESAGAANTTGSVNAFVGTGAGSSNTTGSNNAFFGAGAGFFNTTGFNNTFAGLGAGNSNTTGGDNAFFGLGAGSRNTAGSNNAFFGTNAGATHTTGSNNTIIGSGANVGGSGLSFATAIGAGAVVSASNTIVLGRSADTVNIPGAFSSSILSNPGGSNTLLGSGATVSPGLSFATALGAGAAVSTSNTLVLGRGSDAVQAPGSLTVSGTLLARDQVISQGTIFANVGLVSGGTIIANSGINANGGLNLNNTQLRLRNSSDPNHMIRFDPEVDGIEFRAFDQFEWVRTADNFRQMILLGNGDLGIRGNYLSGSDGRYKTAVETLPQALAQVLRLRGVYYHWKPELKRDARRQLGFIAQEVEAVLPELVNTDEQGFKSVAYANAVPVLVEAIKEQQQQIEELKTIKAENAALKAELEQLRQIVCAANPTAQLCQSAR